MKKIFIMVVLLCSMCAVCLAKLEQPKDDRWVIIGGEKDIYEVWIDTDTIKWKQSGELGHSNHKAARVWMQTLDYKESIQGLFCYEYDIDCSSYRFVNSNIRNDNGKVLESTSREEFASAPIIPGSWFEAIFRQIVLLDSFRDSDARCEICIDAMKNVTKKYKNGEF